MADWSLMDREWPNLYDPYQYGPYPFYQDYQEKQPPQCLQPQAQPYVAPPSPALTLLLSSPQHLLPPTSLQYNHTSPPRDNPREIRNKAEKQRRDKLNQSIAELAAMVPPVVAASRKIDKTGVLRLTAHYLRAHQYVFGDAIGQPTQEITSSTAQALLGILNGFLLTTTYKGIVVVVSQNVHEYLGYTELELLGQNILNITHEEDRRMLKEQLMPKSQMLGLNGELLVSDEPDGKQKVADALASERRRFMIRFKKLGQRSELNQYVTCHVEGSFRMSDRACRGYNKCCQMVRRVRARGENPSSSGNDIVFIGVVRPTADTFITESGLESFRMEYRTRHSIDGEIIQCEQRIALVTGYMTHEVNGVNAMNFMHRDDVRWVIIALREMYDHHRLFGESCYRLMTKNGQFIYMKTRGRLDVDKDSRAVTTFVCTNTVVEEVEGKHLIKQMKKKFSMILNDDEESRDEDLKEVGDNKTISVEDPRQLEKVILHLVTNLPSLQSDDSPRSVSSGRGESPSLRLAIIPPRKERIVSAIEKIYTVIKTIHKKPNETPKIDKHIDIHQNRDNEIKITELNSKNASQIIGSIPSISASSKLAPISDIPLPNDNNFTLTREPSCPRDITNPDTDSVSHSSCASEVEYVSGPEISAESYDLPSVAFSDISNNIDGEGSSRSATKIIYHMIIAPQVNADQITDFQAESNTISLQLPNSSKIGVKRPNEHDDEVITKKKVVDSSKQEYRNEPTAAQDLTSLENFFDEAILNTQIESAIHSLEQTIDPSFPDLLISKDVQDILAEIDEESEEIDVALRFDT